MSDCVGACRFLSFRLAFAVIIRLEKQTIQLIVWLLLCHSAISRVKLITTLRVVEKFEKEVKRGRMGLFKVGVFAAENERLICRETN